MMREYKVGSSTIHDTKLQNEHVWKFFAGSESEKALAK